MKVSTWKGRVMTAVDQSKLIEADRLYDQYGKPFEDTHWGQYIVITNDGKTVIGATMVEAAQRGLRAFGPGNYLFKIGERAIKVR